MEVLLKIRNLPTTADMSPGWTGRRLWLALDRMTCEIEPLSVEYCRTWLGGRGFNAQVLGQHLKGNNISQSSNVPLCFAASPLSGSLAPFLGTVAISGRSGSFFNYSRSAGTQPELLKMGDGFAPAMKYAGFDQVIITGRAAAPVYIFIDPDFIEIRDGRHLWGLETKETCARIRYQELDPGIRILAVGPVAQDHNGMAAILNSYNAVDNGAAIGSDMGSKNLKAIAFRGSGRLALADPENFTRECWKIFDQIYSYSLKKIGKDTGYPLFQSEKNNNNQQSPGSNITRKAVSCWACPAACGTILGDPAQKDDPYFCLESDVDYLKQNCAWAVDYQCSDLIKVVCLVNNLGLSLFSLSDMSLAMAENVVSEIVNFRRLDKNSQGDKSAIITLHHNIKKFLSLTKNNSARKFEPGKGENKKTFNNENLLCQTNLLGGCDQAAKYPQEGEDVWELLYKGLFTYATGVRLHRDDLNRAAVNVLQLEKQLFQTSR